MAEQKENKYITKAGLRDKRGWTNLLMKHFLKEPDLIKDNPHYKSAPQMNLYLLEKIEAVEKTGEFKVMRESALVRKNNASKAVITKKNKIMNYVRGLQIKVPDFSQEQLIKLSCRSYNEHKSWLAIERGYDYEPASKDSDWEFLKRICCNYLRHNCTRYERELEQIFGKVGTNQAYEELKAKINDAIFEKYSFLK